MKTIIAGMDIGFGQAKMCIGVNTQMQKICFPRVFAEAKNMDWGLNDHMIYGIEGDRFFVGQEALAYQSSFLRRDDRAYVTDKTYWLCICKALKEYGIFKDTDHARIKRLILGLAPGHYSRENIKQMKRKALQGIEFASNNRLYRFTAENVKILPQGSGAFFAESLTDNGLIQENSDYRKLYGILDIGYRTTDFLIFENGQFINEKEELSDDTGMRIVLEQLQSYVKQKYDKEELELLEPVLKGRPLEFRGEKFDLNDVVSQLFSEHFRKRIEPEVMKLWEGRINRMHKIIVCGGGAYFLKGMKNCLKAHQKQIHIPIQPEMSNAIGFYRYGVMQENLESVKR